MTEIAHPDLQVVSVLQTLEYDLKRYAAFCDTGSMAFCNPCQAFSLVSNSYSRHCGRDMGRQKEKNQCVWCDGIDFFLSSYENLMELQKRYQSESPEIVIQGIENSFCHMTSGFDSKKRCLFYLD